DGISQILVSVRYSLDAARRRLATGDPRAGQNIDSGIDALGGAIQEVRRISRDLRPGALDDLGLSPALKTLAEEFSERTGIRTRLDTVALRNSLTSEAKTAMYRVAQEALTNIERHAQATETTLTVKPHRRGVTLTVHDNGRGMAARKRSNGIGLRNMTERIEHLGGTFRVQSSAKGTTIEVNLPGHHVVSGVSAASDSPERRRA
ncbi:MAG: ATP-binding protein, partial [Pseudomonadota bacterium]